MMKTLSTLLFYLILGININTQTPEWFTEHLEYMTQGSGTWIAGNSEYKTDTEPIDAYAIEWKWGLGKQSITGRLYGIKDGKETGTYWEFRTFWNPVEKKAYAYQFSGSGAVGMGEMTLKSKGVTRIEQTFYYPDGSTAKTGHESREMPGIHETRSYDIKENGDWEKRRFYRWKLAES